MFLGTYKTTFSGLGRIILPKKMRLELNGRREVVLSRGLDGCIWGFSPLEWDKQAQLQLQIPLTEELGRRMRRYLFSEAEVADLDDQGRFVIPSSLIKQAGIDKEVLIIGAGDHFEIWNEDRWSKLKI